MSIRKFIITLAIVWIFILIGKTLITNIFTEKKDTEEITTEANYDYETEQEVSESIVEDSFETDNLEDDYVQLDSQNKGKTNLFDLTDILHDWRLVDSCEDIKDNIGNSHPSATRLYIDNYPNPEIYYAIVYLDNKYTKLQLNNVFIDEQEKDSTEQTYIALYEYDIESGNRRLIGKTAGFKALSFPESYEIDVSEVECLQICLEGGSISCASLCLDSAYLE